MRAENRGLADLAASVADGTPVDWTAVEGRSNPEDRRLLSHLRLVESIATLHRSIPADGAGGEGGEEDEGFASGPLGANWSEDSAARAAASGPHWGRLVLRDRIGEGTSCEVYRAWDTSLHREVALKLLHEEGSSREARTRILDEARRLARLRHQHVVQVYGAEQHDRRVGLWMELVRGESLEQAVTTHGTFSAREAALIGLDLCSALAAVHAGGLLHRDVKAQNVMREERGRIVLMDFGTGEELARTGEELAGTNRLVGTPLYLAPEIFRGQKASVQSDIYSLGVLLFYLVTGKFPVIASSMEQLARAHAQRQRQPLRDLRPDAPEAYVGAIERALDSDPTRRFQSIGDLEAALRESLQPSARPAPSPVQHVRATPPRRFGFAFGTAAGLLAAAVLALIVWTGWPTAASADVTSLAVLPLADKSAGASPELADALTEQLIATIGQVDSIRTTTISSTMPFKGSSQPRTEIASTLGVDAILEGTLSVVDSAAGGPGTMRVDAKLYKAGTGATLWTGSEVRKRGESALLLSNLARRLTRAIRAQVTTDEASRLKQQGRRTTPAAEEAYLQGRLHLAGYGADAASRALRSFQRAIDADPDYAAAHASAAVAYVKLAGFNAMTHGEAQSSARAEIRKAYETGDDIAEAHAAEADIKFLYEWDWEGAEAEYRRSLELNPSFVPARNNYAQVLAARKRFDEMLRVSNETLLMDPQSVDALTNHGQLLYYKRDFAAAAKVADQAVAIEPGNEFALLLRSRISEAQNQFDAALADAIEARRLTGEPGVNLRVVIIRLQALAGNLDEARRATAALEQAAKAGTLRVRARDLGYLYVAMGRKDDALNQFERALDERDPALVWLTVAPRVDPLRAEPRFQAILQKIGLE